MRGKASLNRLSHRENGPQRRPSARKLTMYASIIFAGVMLLPASSHAEDNKEQLKTLQQSIAEKEKNVHLQQQQRGKLLGQLKQQEIAVSQSSRILHETQTTLAALDKAIARLNQSIKQLEARLAEQQKLLAQQLDAAFRQGRNAGMQLILSGEQSQRNERIFAYYSYLNEAREKSIRDLGATRQALADQKKDLQQKQQQQTALLQQQHAQQDALEKARAARRKTLSGLDSSIAQDQQTLNELRQNESRLRDNIARAEREARARAEREAREAQQVRERQEQAKRKGDTYKPSPSERALVSRTGGLGQPAGQDLWPVRGRTLHRFGESLQGELRWKGMVIAAAEGSEVRAIADGRVLMADWLQGYGLVVVVEHGKGDMSLYGYNQSALVSVGAQVRSGQPIALVGSSGGQGTPALYFEIRRQGQAVNPLPWLGR
ncbi:murein hydrolase activator EnvC [Sodalis sp. C49]|uniref:murein hydrolase activator EnvC n=1 Tax=unclassified Sodalis (in: enterobacteria) TaxID=2636512 RepID=UPI003965CC5C